MPETLNPRSTCTISIFQPINPNPTDGGNKIFGYIQFLVLDQFGYKIDGCVGDIKIDWGDGVISNYPNTNATKIQAHKYNVGPGDCKEFKIKVSMNLSICGLCSGTLTSEKIIKFCNPISCTPFEHYRGED